MNRDITFFDAILIALAMWGLFSLIWLFFGDHTCV